MLLHIGVADVDAIHLSICLCTDVIAQTLLHGHRVACPTDGRYDSGLVPDVKAVCTCCRKQEYGVMASKFVAYNSSKAALNMQTAVLANR